MASKELPDMTPSVASVVPSVDETPKNAKAAKADARTNLSDKVASAKAKKISERKLWGAKEFRLPPETEFSAERIHEKMEKEHIGTEDDNDYFQSLPAEGIAEEDLGGTGFRKYSYNVPLGQEEVVRHPLIRVGMAASDEDNLKLLPAETETAARQYLTQRISKKRLKNEKLAAKEAALRHLKQVEQAEREVEEELEEEEKEAEIIKETEELKKLEEPEKPEKPEDLKIPVEERPQQKPRPNVPPKPLLKLPVSQKLPVPQKLPDIPKLKLPGHPKQKEKPKPKPKKEKKKPKKKDKHRRDPSSSESSSSSSSSDEYDYGHGHGHGHGHRSGYWGGGGGGWPGMFPPPWGYPPPPCAPYQVSPMQHPGPYGQYPGQYGHQQHQPPQQQPPPAGQYAANPPQPMRKGKIDTKGLDFEFRPNSACCTEVTLTIEPDETDPIEFALDNGITPMICCMMPPCLMVCPPGMQQSQMAGMQMSGMQQQMAGMQMGGMQQQMTGNPMAQMQMSGMQQQMPPMGQPAQYGYQ